MEIDEKALQAAIAWYWRAGAISENIPRGCIREYLANLPNPEADVEIVEADRLGYIRGYTDGIKGVDNSHPTTKRESQQPVDMPPAGYDTWQELLDENAEYERLLTKYMDEVERLRKRESVDRRLI